MMKSWVIDRLEQARIMAHPLRMRLLEAFCREPMTTMQAAVALGLPPTKLYHHVAALERVGLVRLVRTRKKRGTTEKYYQTVAHRFVVDRRLFEVSAAAEETLNGLNAISASWLEDTAAELKQSIADKLIQPGNRDKRALLARLHISTTPERFALLQRKLEALLAEFDAAQGQSGTIHYGLTVALYPVKKPKARGRGDLPAGRTGKEKK